MSLVGNICKNGLFQGLQKIFGVSASKFVVVALVLLVGAGCNLQVRQVERAGLRKIPAVIVETVRSEDSQAASSKEAVNVEGAGADDVAEAHIAEQGFQGESVESGDGLKIPDPGQVLPDEGETKEDSPAQIKAAPASIVESPAKFASLPLSPFRIRGSIQGKGSDVGAQPVLASLTTPAGGAKVSSLPLAEESAGKEAEAAPASAEPSPDENGKPRGLPDSSAEQEGGGSGSIIEEPPPGSEEEGAAEPVALALALAAEDIRAEIEVAEAIPVRTESDSIVAVLTSAVTANASQDPAEKSQDEAATGKAAAEKPAERTGEEGSAPEAEAEAKDSAPEAEAEGEVADAGDGGDATAEKPSGFPIGYLIVLGVCLALAIFKHTVGKI